MTSTKAAVPYVLSEEGAEPLEWRDRFQIGGLLTVVALVTILLAAIAFADVIDGSSAVAAIVGVVLVALLFDPSIRVSLMDAGTWDDIREYVARLIQPRSDIKD